MTHYYFAASNIADLSALELHHLYKLRVEVFVHEQHCACAEIDTVDAQPTTIHIRAFGTDRQLVGTCRIFPDTTSAITTILGFAPDVDPALEKVWHIGRLCTLPSQRGTGLGTLILNEALTYAADNDPDKPIFITGQSPLKRYYEGFGFTQCGDEFDWDGVPHLPMLRPAGRPAA